LVNLVEHQVCTRTVLDTTYPGITFNSSGLCSLVDDFEKNVRPNWHSDNSGQFKLEQLAKKIKSSGLGRDFDCLLGLSGGVDSSYMLHLAVKELGLRPLVFHVDGGWNSELSVHNINVLVEKLGVDLFTEVINWEEMRDFQLAMFKSGVPHIDIPQDMAFIGVLYKFARKHNIKYILNGGNVSTEGVPRPLDLIYYGTDMRHINDIVKKFGTVELKTFPFSSVFYHKLYLHYIHQIKVVKPLNFIPYNKKHAISLLEAEYGWKPYAQKHYESRFTRFFEGYWLPTRFDFDLRRVDLSSLVLTGQLSRDEALIQLKKSPYDVEQIKQDFEYIAAKLNISSDELNSYHQSEKKFYWDYKNLSNVFTIGEFILARFQGTRRGGAF
jgi:N-acetyl sugar amidotransferase